MKKVISLLLLLRVYPAASQELFVYTEPASNMAAKGVGIRLNNYLMQQKENGKINYHLLPELMWGVSRKLMLHTEAFLSNRDGKFVAEGGSLYGKYRFYSEDEVHSHFRIAAMGKYSFNNSSIHQQAIDFYGHSSGYEAGLVATKLIKKTAISISVSGLHALDNANEKFAYGAEKRNALGYTLSVGTLVLPKEYTNYKQVNMNLLLELLGQTNLGDGSSYFDVAPAMQFIFNSRWRVDLAYRFPLVSTLQRTADKGALVRLEYNLFNVFK